MIFGMTSPSAEYFDQWYADMAVSPTHQDVAIQTLGLPPELESTSLLSWDGIADVTDALGVGPDDVLVDLACGRGGYGLEIARRTGAELIGVDFSTGSLGHGLSIGVGAALGARMQGSQRRVVVLVSDAECDEGSLWEAVMLAAHQHLGNLIAIVDLNGQQALGYTKDVLSLDPLGDRWGAFGWDVLHVDGHDVPGLTKAIASLNDRPATPHVLIAHTVFGHGVSYMRNQIKWHYLPMSQTDYEVALNDIKSLQ